MKNFTSILFFLLLSFKALATTYYVTKTGLDSNAGNVSAPWLTIGKAATVMVAGDTCIVGDGDYDEQVYETTSGSSGNYITYQAANKGLASIRAWRLGGQYIKIDGFTINKYSGIGNTWGAAVRIEPAAHYTIITNCTIKDLPYVIGHDFSFDAATKKVTSTNGDFIAAGFKVGSKVYLGASGLSAPFTPLYFLNHDTTWEVASVSQRFITLTNGSAPFLTDAGTNYWAFVRAGSGNSGFDAILAVESGGVGPHDVQITNNIVTNWAAHAFDVSGDSFLIENNTLTNLKSFRFLSFSGSNHIIRRNVVKNCPGVLHYTEAEIKDGLKHPVGTGWYDYQVAMLSGFVGDGTETNILIEENWFENIENQIGRVDDSDPGVTGIIYNKNVFIGCTDHFSGGRDNMEWTDNTFYKCSFGSAAHPLSIGGLEADAHTGYVVTGNIFVACGAQGATETLIRGYYSIADWATGITNNNFVASEELTGYIGKTDFSEVNGINGGDPVFYSVTDFVGPDGEVFTADDGLQVLPNSVAAPLGGGALGVYSVINNEPVANFRITSPNGWFEPTGDDYDPVWMAKLPTTRGAPIRPFNVPVKVGEIPVTVTFNAAKSMSGVSGATTNTAISQYAWNFGDGTAVQTTSSPTISHTFTTFGDFTVVLTVTNTSSNTASYSQTYRFTGVTASPGDIIRVPTDYATIDLAIGAADAGDTILIAAGVYNESLSTDRSGTAEQRIIIDGQGVVTAKSLTLNHSYITVRGMKFTGVTSQYGSEVKFTDTANFNIIEDCIVDCAFAREVYGISWSGGSDGGSDNIIQRTTIENVWGYPMVSISGDRNTLRNCIIQNGLDVDFLRLFGTYHLVQNNLFQNNNAAAENIGNHPDFVQTFGNNGEVSNNHIIEKNIVRNAPVAQLSQLSGTGVPDIRDWTIRNNIFAYIGLSGSCTAPGIKYYNNIFFRCSYIAKGQAINFGSRKHDRFDINKGNAEYSDLLLPKNSGELVSGNWYNVELPEVQIGVTTVSPPVVPSIVAGKRYKVRTREGAKVLYNGIEYINNEEFDGVDGVTTFTLLNGDNANVYIYGYVTYKGVNYYRDQAFLADATSTFTTSNSDTLLYRNLINFSHNSSAKNNVFLECGEIGNNTNGWYSFDTTLTGVSADYNYVAKHGITPVRVRVGSVPVGTGDWSGKGWYEPNGINAVDPKFTDYSNLDFRLQPTSPLIDAGTDLAAVVSDIIGTVRPLGVKTDIGPYEYNDGSPPPPPPPPPDPIPPAAPSSVRFVSATTSSISIAWNDLSDNESAFEVEGSSDGVGYTLLTTTAQNVTNYTETGLTASQIRYYRVRAKNSVGNSAYSTSVSMSSSATTNPPAAPSSFTALTLSSSIVLLTWVDNSTTEIGFEFERSTNGTTWTFFSHILPNRNSLVVSGLNPSTLYHFRIRALGLALGDSAWVQTSATTANPIIPTKTGRQPRANQVVITPP